MKMSYNRGKDDLSEKGSYSMASDKDNLALRTELLEKAKTNKRNRFLWSGMVIVAIGLIIIAIGFSQNDGFPSFSSESLLIGIGAIVVLVGSIRMLIGLINPTIPIDINEPASSQPGGSISLDDLFKNSEGKQ